MAITPTQHTLSQTRIVSSAGTTGTGDTWTIWNGATTASLTASTWGNWNANMTCVSSCNSTGTVIWTAWVNSASTTTGANIVWPQWVQTGTAIPTRRINGAPAYVRQRSEAEVQRELREQAEWRKRQEEATAKRAAAGQRAERLLVGALRPEQRRDLEEKGCFYLHTQSGRRYRIDRGSHGNVKLIDEKGSVVSSFCAQPHGVPDADAMLAQKLMLETDEQAFLRVANETRWRQ